MNVLQLVSRVSSRRMRGTTSKLSPFSTLPVEQTTFMRRDSIDNSGKKIHHGFHIDRSGDGPLVLQTKNPHEMDAHITYNGDSHQYYFDGRLLDSTCTGLVSQFFEKFDADLVITKMMQGNNWPRKEYEYPNGQPYTADQIKQQWSRSSEYSMNYGTWLHYNIERYFNGMKPSEKLPEMSQFYEFEKLWIQNYDIAPLRTEWQIALPERSLGGTVDFVGQKADGSYVIMDWKRSLKLEKNLTNLFNKKALHPLEHIDDCEGTKYFLQLNLYKHILEEKYNIKVSSMVLASFHAKLDHYFAVEVPTMDYEINQIIGTLGTDKSTDSD
mmetsp:Transcript_4596/g.7783  ORF Transcript_4596/g.7783 Transcript_4596/m.7783 type:complete len:326 (-) Transcript_4596:1371-2348(-)